MVHPEDKAEQARLNAEAETDERGEKPMTDQRDFYGISHMFSSEHPGGEWLISHHPRGYALTTDPVVWRSVSAGEQGDDGQPPPAVRAAYEKLIGYDPDARSDEPENIVEMIAEGDDCAFDQPCRFGHRVEGHSVYCHNTKWLYAPRKCRRSQHDEEWTHQRCAGFEPNPGADDAASW